MINTIIIKYLQTNRRLVIPKLGAFIVKDDNQTIVFSELLRSDDGVLRELIKQHGVGDIEAAGVIDRFVFEVRHTLDRNMPHKIGNLGTLRRDEKGKIVFMSFRTQLQQPTRQASESARPTPVTYAPKTAESPTEEKRDVQSTDAPRKKQGVRRKPDIFMVIAVIVSIVAICAILYGVLCNREQEEAMPFPELEGIEMTEDMATDDVIEQVK